MVLASAASSARVVSVEAATAAEVPEQGNTGNAGLRASAANPAVSTAAEKPLKDSVSGLAETFAEILRVQNRFFDTQVKREESKAERYDAQHSVAKPPDRFVESAKANIQTWLESVEVYFRAKSVPEKEWGKTLITYLGESALVKVKRIKLDEKADDPAI